MINRRKILISLLLVVLIAFGFIFSLSYLGSNKLIVEYKNADIVSVYTKENFNNNFLDKKSATVKQSGQAIRLQKGEYVVTYSGVGSYSGGSTEISINEGDKKITINPTFSDDKLNAILSDELPSINSSIQKQIPGVSLYLVQKGSLYSFGEWYGTTLIYNGDDPYNADSLRLIMKKQDGLWQLQTTPPQILITKAQYPDIPGEIVEAVNNQSAPIPNKYTGESN